MTDRAEIERLLNQTGRSLEGLPVEYSPADRIDCILGLGIGGSCADRILHQSDVIELLIGALRDALAKQPKLISVKERLPEKLVENNSVYLSEEVIGFDGECAYIGQFKTYKFDGHFVFFDGNGFREDVTHWMPLPLPEPPRRMRMR